MAFRSDLDAVILGVLDHGPKHGYGIVKTLSTRSNGMVKLGEGQLYPTLHRLEGDGLVSADWLSQEGRPAKRVYCITDSGRKELEALRKTWRAFRSGVDAILKDS